MNIAIMDDDKKFAVKARELLNRICDKFSISLSVDVYTDEKIFVNHISKFELILLDIEMPQINGLDLCNRINEERTGDFPYVIFVSNRDNLVFEALKLIPYSFIRKCDFEFELESRVMTLYKRIEAAKIVYTIKDGYNDVNLEIHDIIYLEKSKNYILFHTVSRTYKERNKIDVKEKELSGFGFVRINVGYIVNIRYVVSIANDKIELKTGTILSVSKPYRTDVRKKCSNFWSD